MLPIVGRELAPAIGEAALPSLSGKVAQNRLFGADFVTEEVK